MAVEREFTGGVADGRKARIRATLRNRCIDPGDVTVAAVFGKAMGVESDNVGPVLDEGFRQSGDEAGPVPARHHYAMGHAVGGGLRIVRSERNHLHRRPNQKRETGQLGLEVS